MRAKRQTIRKPRPKDWSNKEDEKLKKLYNDPTLSLVEIVEKMTGRTYMAVASRAKRLGIRRPYIDQNTLTWVTDNRKT